MQNKIISKPGPDEYPLWFAGEIELVHYNDLESGLIDSCEKSLTLLGSLNDQQLSFRYAEGKWTIPEIWQHIIDTERVLTYRAMRYSRGDRTVLSGFDHEKYTVASKPNLRPWIEMLAEYTAVRKASVLLFKSFDKEMLMLKGIAGRSELSVRAVGYLVLGHNIHHLNTIKEKYL